jgi:hypothetical protein
LLLGACASCSVLLGYGDPVELAARDASDASPDAPTEAAPEGGAGEAGVPFCESQVPQPTFCTSFDGPSYLAGWDPSGTPKNVRVERDAVNFASAPASLRVAFDRTTGGGASGAVGIDFVAFDGKPFTATVGVDVRVEAAAPQGALAVISDLLLVSTNGGPSYLLQLVCRPLPDGASVSVGLVEVPLPSGASTEHGSSGRLTLGRWSRVQLVASGAGSGNHARLAIDGAPVFDGALVIPMGTGVPGSNFGITAVDTGTTAWAFNLDNVTIDMK